MDVYANVVHCQSFLEVARDFKDGHVKVGQETVVSVSASVGESCATLKTT